MTGVTPLEQRRRSGLRRSFQLSAAVAAMIALFGCVTFVDSFSGRREACEIIAIGSPATAKIVRLVDTGTTINNDPVVDFYLLVSPTEGSPYEAHAKALISRLDVPAFQPGRVVPVRYDPQTPTRVAIDLWECPDR